MKQTLLRLNSLRLLLLFTLFTVGGANSWGQKSYRLITSDSELEAGANYIIATIASIGTGSVDVLAEAAANNRKSTSLSVADNVITTTVASSTSATATAYAVTIEANSKNWYLKDVVANKYLNGGSTKSGSGNNNYLQTATTATTTSGIGNNNGVWTISIASSGVATIKNANNFTIKKNSQNALIASYSSGQTSVGLYKEVPSKSTSNLTITNTENTINLEIGGTASGDITYTTSSDGAMSFTSNNTSVATVNSTGTVTAVAEGSTTITVSQAEGTSYAASSNLTVTVKVTDARTAVGKITAISPSTVYVGQTGEFTLTTSYTGTVSSTTWSLGTGEDSYLNIAHEVFEGLAEGNATVTVTATPADVSTYKPVTASFPVSVEYKYAAPSLPSASIFTTTKNITIGTVSGADVYYTTDGTTPSSSSTKYTAAFDISATTTVKAIAIDGNGLISPVSSATYTKEDVLDINYSEVTFNAFTGAGSGYDNGAEKDLTFTASDSKTQINISGTYIMSNSGLQFKAATGTFTTQWIANGNKAFSFTATFTNSLDYEITYANGESATSGSLTSNTAVTPSYFPCKITLSSASGSNANVMTAFKLTPVKDPISTSVSITDPGVLAKDAAGTFSASSTDAAECTKVWSSSNSSVIEITNASTGAYTAAGRGTATVTYIITPNDATTYRAVAAERVVSVTAPVEVSASDVVMTYGDAAKSICATTSTGYAGTLSYNSGNTSIATIDASGKVTAVAVGSTTITISAPADAENLYTAGVDKVVNVTVSAPTGGTAAAESTQTAAFSEALTSSTKATGWTYTEWTTNSSYGACSTANTAGQLITKDYLIPDKANPCVYFEHTGKTFEDPSVACRLYVQEGNNTPVELTIPTYFKGDKYDNPYIESGDIDISDYIGKTVHFIFDYNPSTGNDGKWEVKSFGIYYDTFSVKLNSNGYATFCSEYGLDFTDVTDFSAWQITDIDDDNKITFEKVTGSVKGGTGLFLMGEASSNITIPSAESTNTLSSNKLVGTLAPSYFEAGEIYGLSGSTFKKNSTGTIKANKAYLPANLITVDNGDSGVKGFTFVFNDETTGISETRNVSAAEAGEIFNLAGQRLDNSQLKRGIYVVNGKKVLVK